VIGCAVALVAAQAIVGIVALILYIRLR